jgi:predicted enzyme related to lactoylglutathione lyase
MPVRDEAPVGAPCWVELFTSDPDRSRAFYGELFGWTSEEPNEALGGYFNFFLGDRHIAGGMGNSGEDGAPDVWSVYLATDDIKRVVDDAAAANGQVMVPPMQVMDLGAMAVLLDAGQASIGVWQPGVHKGFGVIDEPGAPSWFEVHTRAYDDAVSFYRDVFGWETSVVSDAPEFRYTTLGEGDAALAGIMDASGFLPEGVPSHWSVYFGTADIDASLAKAVDLGGSIVLPAEDTPYGRIAQAADPTGVAFKLRQPLG